jgi:putative membrane-bound dehydrogenase-like protein
MDMTSAGTAAAWLIALATIGQLSPEKQTAAFTVSPGLEIKLWASEPLFVNPTTFDIDPSGRIWVCEAVNYRRKLRGQPPLRMEGDRVVIVADSNGDGTADKATTFYQAPEIMSPIGIAVAQNPSGKGCRVYLCQSPDILVLEDKDGDDKADGPPTKLLTGFQGLDHDHGVHGISIGPDGRLYFSVGDTGVKDLKSSDGKGPTFNSNSVDLRAGTVWRCDLDGRHLELIAHNFRNNYMPAIDSFGNVFISDNDDDGNQQTRICFVMPGGNYGYHPRGAGQTHWHEEQPGVVPKVLRTFFGSPTGMCFYEGQLLPEKYRGQMLHTDAGPRQLRSYRATPKGAGFDVEREDMVTSTDNWFRPSDVRVGPDGSVFIADWYDPGVGGHGMGDTTRGRIFRLAPPGHKPAHGITTVDSPESARTALASPCLATHAMAFAWLRQQSQAEAIATARPMASGNQPDWLKARARWVLAESGAKFQKSDFDGLDHASLAAQAARIVRDYPAMSGLAAQLPTNDAAVTRETLVGLRETDGTKAHEAVMKAAKAWDGKDIFLVKSLAIAAGGSDARRQTVLADFASSFPEWNDRTAALAFELRPPGMTERLRGELSNSKLTSADRIRLIDFVAGDSNPAAGKALLEVLVPATPPEVRNRAVDVLLVGLPGQWSLLVKDGTAGKALESMVANNTNAMATEYLALAGAISHGQAISMATTIALSPAAAPALRERAVAALGKLPTDSSVKVLETLAKEGGKLTGKACLALGELASARTKTPASDPALKALQGLLNNEAAKSASLEAIASTRAGTSWLLEEKMSEKLPADLVSEAGRLLRNSPYQDLRNKAMVAFPAPGKIDARKLPSSAKLALRQGNAARGKALMAASTKSDLQCLKCHMAEGRGGQIGPDLSQIGKKASRENLLDSMLTPSKAIADQYLVHVVTTNKGLAISGLLMEETADMIVLRDANGKDHRIGKKEIDERARLQESIMPANLVASMSEDDLLDLAEYLLTLKSATLAPKAFRMMGPLEGGPGGDTGFDTVFDPEKKLDFTQSIKGKNGPVGWRTVRPDANGYVDLANIHGESSNNSLTYLATTIDSPSAQKAMVVLGADDCSRVWVNGTRVHEDRSHEAAIPGKFRIPVQLNAGSNVILLKISNGGNPHGFYLSIASEQDLKEAPLP